MQKNAEKCMYAFMTHGNMNIMALLIEHKDPNPKL